MGRDPTYSEISRGIDGNIQYSEDGIIIYKPLSIKTPVWKDEFETLDISTSYRFKNGTTLFLQATNVLAEPNKRYVGVKDETTHLLRSYNETGAFYIAGVRARF